jgi:sarcosine oxidase
VYKIAVIGRGLIGSAAGRHLSMISDGIAVIGPNEPEDPVKHEGVFASHYDEGRMVRFVDPQISWSITAKRSIERFLQLQMDSGINFFTTSGYLGLQGPEFLDYLEGSEFSAKTVNANFKRINSDEIRKDYPFLSIDDNTVGLVESGLAGHISPRNMVNAQTKIARKLGADIIEHEVGKISLNNKAVEITLRNNEKLLAEKVLVATGAFTDACDLLPKSLNLIVYGRTVVLAEIDKHLEEILNIMPTMYVADSNAYILPPIKYPDGKTYLKIGIGNKSDKILNSRSELIEWFQGKGSEQDFRDFREYISHLIPSLQDCENWHTKSCAVTQTATGLPYIDYVVEDRIAVATGGNGKAAKSADDWGLFAAQMMVNDNRNHPISHEELQLPKTKENIPRDL